MIIGYCRVSTSEQAENSYALEQQRQRLISAGAQEIFQDVQSGTSKKRPNFNKLKQKVMQGEISEIIVTRIDRIARNLVQLKEFAEVCVENGVNLKILDQNMDLSTPHGKLMFNIIGSMAEWEIDLLRSRVTHGLKHMRDELRAPGNIPFGYTKGDNDRYAPDLSIYKDTGKTRWEIAGEIVEEFLRLGSVRATVRNMTIRYGDKKPDEPKWHTGDFPRLSGLKTWLTNPVLRGATAYYYTKKKREPVITPDTHEPLISPAQWSEIQKHLSIHAPKTKPDREPAPLAGLVYCGKCGAKCKRCTRRYSNKVKNPRQRRAGELFQLWYCSAKCKPNPTCPGSKAVWNSTLEEAVISKLIERGHAIAALDFEGEIEIQETIKLREAKSTLSSLEALAPNEFIEETKVSLRTKIASMENELKAEALEKSQLKTELAEHIDDPDFWLYVKESGELKRMFRRFIQQVVITDNLIEVKTRI